MTTVQQDYILRKIQMIGEVIAIALKQRKSGYLIEADGTLTDAMISILPEHADLIEMVDKKTALALLGDSRLVETYIELLLERAIIKVALGEDTLAESIQRRALRLFMASLNRDPSLSVDGLLLWGKLTGLELQLILNATEYTEWTKLDQFIQDGTIRLL